MKVKYLRPKQVEKMFGIPVKTLANFRWMRKGPPYRKVGRAVLYRPDEVANWIEKHCENRRG